MCDKTYYEVGIWFMSVGATLFVSSILIGSNQLYTPKPVPMEEIKLKF